MSAPNFAWNTFDRLRPADLYAVLRLRAEVFVVEQRCAYLDLDGLDPMCWHLLATQGQHLVGYLRLVPPGVKYAEPSLGRVVTAGAVRRTGVGRLLFAEGVSEAKRQYPGQAIRIGAQRYLESFYGSFGFVSAGSPYEEDGIPHLEMVLTHR